MVNRQNTSKTLKPIARQATPTKLTKSMRSDGLVLRVGIDGILPSDALELARRITREGLEGEWVVAPMGTQSRDFTVRRKREIRNPTVQQAFDLSYKLQEHRDVEDCEPSLILPSEAPEAMHAEHVALRVFASSGSGSSGSSSSGGGSDDDPNALPCTAAHDWALRQCSVLEAWALTPTATGKARGEGIVIGHPDTGYTDHPELDGARILKTRGKDFEEGDVDPRDTLAGQSGGHGTSTGSVIMSGDGTGAVVSGVAPLAKLVPLRVTTSVVLFSFGKLAEAIRYAADDGQHVLSISLGGPIGSRFLTRAVQYAIDRGLIIVSAAGNVWPFVVYPAKLDQVVAVAASNCRNEAWTSTASGSAVDITAPGESVWRALTKTSGFTIGRSSGTSYATAITAGAAALWLAHHGRDALIQRYGIGGLASVFKELLLKHGFDRPAGWDTDNLGSGVLNAEKLLKAPLPTTVAAGSMRALRISGPPRSISLLERFVDLFPTMEAASVREGLQSMFSTDEASLNSKLNQLADEVMYYAVTDIDFRRSLMAGTAPARGVKSAGTRATAKAVKAKVATQRNAPVLPKVVSKKLRRMTK